MFKYLVGPYITIYFRLSESFDFVAFVGIVRTTCRVLNMNHISWLTSSPIELALVTVDSLHSPTIDPYDLRFLQLSFAMHTQRWQ